MICRYCGNEIRDDAKFCPHCGAVNGPESLAGPGTGAAYTGPEAPRGGKKKTGLFIGGAVAAAAVVALLVAAVSGMFSSPKGQLEKAVAKSLAAYTRAEEALGLPDLNRLTEEQSVSQRMSLRLTGLNTAVIGYDLSALEGLGLRFQSDLNGKDKTLGMELAGFWDSQDLLSIQMAVDGAEAYFASPQLTGGDFYGVNTETLGADLKRMGVQDVGDISFNFFDLVDIVAPKGQTEAMEEAVREANKALFDAVKVEKGGKKTISVNQTETKTEAYLVTIPKQAMKDYANALAGALSQVDYAALYREIFQAIGMPEEELEDMLGELEDLDPYRDLADSLGELLDEVGDLKLTVYVGNGYVSALVYENYLDNGRGASLKLSLYLGGGEEYVDNLRLEVKADGQTVTVDSSGDHGCKGGAFTDKTTIRGPFSTVSSELRYEPGKGEDNLSWKIAVPGAGSLEMAGQLTGGEESVGLHLEELALKVLGMEVFSVEMDYYMGPFDGRSVAIRNPRLIGEMDGVALMAAAVKLQTNAQIWMEDMQTLFLARLPEELLYGLPYEYSVQ